MDGLVAAGLATGHTLTAVQELRGSDRSRVVRAMVDAGPATVIVKMHQPGFADHWAREAAALTMLRGRGLPVPDLIAAVDHARLVVLEDVGDGPNLADALLGESAATATERLDAWVDALAAVHAATSHDAARFAAALGADASTVDPMPGLLAHAADLLSEQLPRLGVTPDPRALTALRSARDTLGPAADALTPADACPDNNVVTPSGLVLLDFEQAGVLQVAWDAAYLVIPWPSCWCSWGLPAAVTEAALTRWREAVAPSLPAVGSDAFDRDLDIAVVGWAFISSAWYLAGASEDERESSGDEPRLPTRRAVIRHRMRLAAERSAVAPALASLAEDVLVATERRWGDLRLDDAPAFR
jgi:hypothetical protein